MTVAGSSSRVLEVLRVAHWHASEPLMGAIVRVPGGAVYMLSDWVTTVPLLILGSTCCGEQLRVLPRHPLTDPRLVATCARCYTQDAVAETVLVREPSVLADAALTQDLAEAVVRPAVGPLEAVLAADRLLAEARLLLACLAAERALPDPHRTAAAVLRRKPTGALREARVLAEFERRRAAL